MARATFSETAEGSPEYILSLMVDVFLYVIAAATVEAGGDADDPLEGSGKMALIGETAFEADVSNRKTAGEKGTCVVDPLLDKVGVGGKPHGCAKEAQEVKFTQPGDTGQLGKCDIVGVRGVEILESGLHGAAMGGYPLGSSGPLIGVARHHVGKDGQQEGLPL